MKGLKKHTLQIFFFIIIIIGVSLIFVVKNDNNSIKNNLINSKRILNTKIEEYNLELDNIYKYTDSLSMSDLIFLKESGLNLKKELFQFQNTKESEIEELYLHQIKYWAFFIAALSSIIVVTGLQLNISEKTNKLIAETLKIKEDEIEKLVNEKSWEFRLMKKAHIMIVNPNKENDNKETKKVLKWFGKKGSKDSTVTLNDTNFSNPDKIIEKVKEERIEERLNVLLLENSDGNWNLKDLNNKSNAIKIASNLPDDIMLIYFGPRDVGDFPARASDYKKINETDLINARKTINRIAFTNSPSKLYSNILDTLKYMDIIDTSIDA